MQYIVHLTCHNLLNLTHAFQHDERYRLQCLYGAEGEASHEAVGLWPSCSITGMTLNASNIDAKDGLLARTDPYGRVVFRASSRCCLLVLPT
jgi:hypothetical protein